MAFELNATHHQHELEAEAEHARLVREARSGRRNPSAVSRARAGVGAPTRWRRSVSDSAPAKPIMITPPQIHMTRGL